jgi:hypothetical protein
MEPTGRHCIHTQNTGNKNKRQKITDAGVTITDPYYCLNLLH